MALSGELSSWAASEVKLVRLAMSASLSAPTRPGHDGTVPKTVTTATAMNWKSAVSAGHWPVISSTAGWVRATRDEQVGHGEAARWRDQTRA